MSYVISCLSSLLMFTRPLLLEFFFFLARLCVLASFCLLRFYCFVFHCCLVFCIGLSCLVSPFSCCDSSHGLLGLGLGLSLIYGFHPLLLPDYRCPVSFKINIRALSLRLGILFE